MEDTDSDNPDEETEAPELGNAEADTSEPVANSESDQTGSTETANAPVEGGQQTEQVSTPEFPDLRPRSGSASLGSPSDLNRLFDVQVTVAAELGRTSVPIQKLLGLTEGSVFELDRSVSSPIELVAQGVPLGNGEVVVVDDSFAIRIKEIYARPS